ncbi:MAG: hypothetical protein CGU28_16465 [Candidatus Dactylopiibacterium carminicum]|nr:MAG: hypothetical protein CGU28_16465 [Candidatus Dactylopiibacterium carminicum]
MQVIHEGIDTENLGPDPDATLVLSRRHSDPPTSSEPAPGAIRGQAGLCPSRNSETSFPEGNESREDVSLILKAGDPIITYVARNLEPYRGFHQFMRALPAVLKAHPAAQVLIVGGDERSYGSLPTDAPNWRESMLRELTFPSPLEREGPGERGRLPADWPTRIHFLGKLPYETYKKVLQVSALHVYLTYPFVLSWSLLEAMVTGCRILASDTAPVREVIRDGENGELVAFFDVPGISRGILDALNDTERGGKLRRRAQETAQAYGLAAGLQAYAQLLGLNNESINKS